jgi:predicted DCC family thiol-disulfide oxidoreductase YuxK
MAPPAIVFYDGGCGLCHRAVRFALHEDRDGTRFRFAPLDSDAFRAAVPEAMRATLPDSIVLRDDDGTLHVRSDAVLTMCKRLGGRWRVLATIAGVLPRRLLDAAYDFVARVRLRLFTPPEAACPMLPPHLRDRFL